jgi:hypothetical protein
MRAFLNTNVLVYAHDTDASDKCAVALELIRSLWDAREGAPSTQVAGVLRQHDGQDSGTRLDARRSGSCACVRVACGRVDAADILVASELQERQAVLLGRAHRRRGSGGSPESGPEQLTRRSA